MVQCMFISHCACLNPGRPAHACHEPCKQLVQCHVIALFTCKDRVSMVPQPYRLASQADAAAAPRLGQFRAKILALASCRNFKILILLDKASYATVSRWPTGLCIASLYPPALRNTLWMSLRHCTGLAPVLPCTACMDLHCAELSRHSCDAVT